MLGVENLSSIVSQIFLCCYLDEGHASVLVVDPFLIACSSDDMNAS